MLSRRFRPFRALLGALLASAAISAPAWAHAVVYPRTSAPGAYERYVLRVPNERDAPTQRVEITFPAGLRVVSFGDVPGWTLEVRKDASGAITGAVWTGTLAAERFVELPFIAVNPKSDARLVWPATQTYAGGERVEWTGGEDSKTPASVTQVAATSGESGGSSKTGLYLGGGALLVAMLALGLALRRQ
jgi:uncharacterized protein YcnI